MTDINENITIEGIEIDRRGKGWWLEAYTAGNEVADGQYFDTFADAVAYAARFDVTNRDVYIADADADGMAEVKAWEAAHSFSVHSPDRWA